MPLRGVDLLVLLGFLNVNNANITIERNSDDEITNNSTSYTVLIFLS
jgi:hypothetical protein